MRKLQLIFALEFLMFAACSDATSTTDASAVDAAVARADAAAHDDAAARRDAEPAPDAPPAPLDAEPAPDAPPALDAETDAGAPGDAGTSTAGWPRPRCGTIQGTAGVTFTFDEGHTLAPTAQMLSGVAYTYGVAALDEPGVVLAVHAGVLIRSTDSGCTWTAVGPLPGGFPVTLAAAGRDRAYAWADNNRELYRIDGTTITPLTSPVDNIIGLAVDRTNPDRLRLGGPDGQLYESTTAGVGRFSAVGAAPFGPGGLVYRVAFDPRDLDHAAAGSATSGAVWTEDGGLTWTPVSGLSIASPRGGNANVFNIAYSPASHDVVWFQGIDLADSMGGPGDGRHIWRSVDGGRSASVAVTQSSTVTLINGTLLAPHPREPALLYFVFGTYFQGYGTDLFRYDAIARRITVEHNGYDEINAIDFSPTEPQVMFLGVTSERIR